MDQDPDFQRFGQTFASAKGPYYEESTQVDDRIRNLEALSLLVVLRELGRFAVVLYFKYPSLL